MTTSIFKELTAYQEIGGNMINRIKALGVYDVFQPIAESNKYQGQIFNATLWWILFCYSVESDKVIPGIDWKKTKANIAKEFGLPPTIINLEDDAVSKTVWNYIRHQEDADWEHYNMLKEQYIIMREGALGIVKRERKEKRLSVDEDELQEEEFDVVTIVYDYEQMYKNGVHADDLLARIKTYEVRLKTSGQTSDQTAREVQEKQNRHKGTILDVASNSA